MARAYLAVVGMLYLALATWCSISPGTTAPKVGFALQPGSGQSEFLTVYGGLEFGLALIFLVPLLKPDVTPFTLLSCLLIHGSLVLFRTAGFAMYSGIASTTYKLAIGEWLLFLSSAAIYLAQQRSP